MQLSDLDKIAEEADAGRWLELRHPVDGSPTGIKLLIAGPDSTRQHKAQLALQTKIGNSRDRRGRVDVALADELYVGFLADLVLNIEATEDGQPVPFSHDAAVRIISAGRWVRNQVEAFAEVRA